eukprot:2410171-Pyramimonas_sp.AAC.1
MVTCLNDGVTYKFKAAQLPLPEPWHSPEHSGHQLASAHSAASTQEVPIHPAYISADKNAKQDAFADHNVGAQRAEGVITFDAVPLVAVEVQGPDEPSKLRWDMPILARFKIDKQPL